VTRGDARLGYGDSYGRYSRGATPSEYLDRLAIHNRLFSDDVRLESIVPAGDNLALVTSQPFIKGRDAEPGEIKSMMEGMGFERLGEGAYYHAREGLLVSDLQPRNVKMTDSGELHVIDSVIQRVTPDFAEHVRPWFKEGA
jgi:hypothetical protein